MRLLTGFGFVELQGTSCPLLGNEMKRREGGGERGGDNYRVQVVPLFHASIITNLGPPINLRMIHLK